MTDNEIIKALECCNGWDGRCLNCPLNREGTNCKEKLNSYAFDLINRQKAEIERLKEYNETLLTANVDLWSEILDIKSEAIKEVAEKLKYRADKRCNYCED